MRASDRSRDFPPRGTTLIVQASRLLPTALDRSRGLGTFSVVNAIAAADLS
jgi:hypothetical protein